MNRKQYTRVHAMNLTPYTKAHAMNRKLDTHGFMTLYHIKIRITFRLVQLVFAELLDRRCLLRYPCFLRRWLKTRIKNWPRNRTSCGNLLPMASQFPRKIRCGRCCRRLRSRTRCTRSRRCRMPSVPRPRRQRQRRKRNGGNRCRTPRRQRRLWQKQT